MKKHRFIPPVQKQVTMEQNLLRDGKDQSVLSQSSSPPNGMDVQKSSTSGSKPILKIKFPKAYSKRGNLSTKNLDDSKTTRDVTGENCISDDVYKFVSHSPKKSHGQKITRKSQLKRKEKAVHDILRGIKKMQDDISQYREKERELRKVSSVEP